VFWMTALEPPWPLYGLDRLAARAEAQVIVLEGEKSADAASHLFPDFVAISWMSGANNVAKAELIDLKGRHLVLWPDNDPPGRSAMQLFAARAYEAGAASVKMVDVPSGFPQGWDVADEVPAEVAEQYPLRELVETARLIEPSEVAHLLTDKQQQQQAEQRSRPRHARERVVPRRSLLVLRLLRCGPRDLR
jgi:DNA primase